MNKLYMLEHFVNDGKDVKCGVPIEDVQLVGFFSTTENLNQAIFYCNRVGVPSDELRIQTFFLDIAATQRNVYVLSYSYRVYEEEEYYDYFVMFAPATNERHCRQLKAALLRLPEYQPSPEHEFLLSSNGFYIHKYPLDHIMPVTSFDAED